MPEPIVVEKTLILTDANGDVTEDRAVATGGEVLERLDDGTTRSTLFEIDPSASVDGR